MKLDEKQREQLRLKRQLYNHYKDLRLALSEPKAGVIVGELLARMRDIDVSLTETVLSFIPDEDNSIPADDRNLMVNLKLQRGVYQDLLNIFDLKNLDKELMLLQTQLEGMLEDEPEEAAYDDTTEIKENTSEPVY